MIDFILIIASWFSASVNIAEPKIIINQEFHQSAPKSREIITPNLEKEKSHEKNECNEQNLVHFSAPDKRQTEITDPTILIPKFSRDSLPTPAKVKGIYMTGYSFTNKKKRAKIFKLLEKTELNSVVIDFQDPQGDLMFPTKNKNLQKIPLSEISLSREKFREILTNLQNDGIYTIARITTFQDEGSVVAFPDLALKNKWGNDWKNYNKLGWLDMTNQEAWQIPLLKSIEAAEIGFDEIQFDYIRFPTDGSLKLIKYANLGERKRYEVMSDFFRFLSENQRKIGVPISADLFGITYEKYAEENISRDFAIGQRAIDAAKYFDYLSPMIYPSHYADGYAGYANPANFPYQIVDKAMREGNHMIKKYTDESISKSRPWLQAFNLGAVYDYHKIRAQIKAVDDNNGSGWILWNARNVYEQVFK